MGQLIRAGKRRIPDADLRRIETPTALIWGRHDRFVPLSLAMPVAVLFVISMAALVAAFLSFLIEVRIAIASLHIGVS